MPLKPDPKLPVKLIYFMPIEGRAQQRFGAGAPFGWERTDEGNIVWSKEPQAVGESEYRKYLREYTGCVRRGDLLGPFQSPQEALAANQKFLAERAKNPVKQVVYEPMSPAAPASLAEPAPSEPRGTIGRNGAKGALGPVGSPGQQGVPGASAVEPSDK